jgi:hypothetical protein
VPISIDSCTKALEEAEEAFQLARSCNRIQTGEGSACFLQLQQDVNDLYSHTADAQRLNPSIQELLGKECIPSIVSWEAGI